MGRPTNAIAPIAIKSKPTGVHADGGGLYLRVTPAGDGQYWRSWVFRYMLDGKAREMGLGPWPDVPLAEARSKATAARALKRDGHDPISFRRAERAAAAAKGVSFKRVVEDYIANHASRWKNDKTGDQWRASLRDYAYPIFGDLPVESVSLALIEEALRPIWETKAETARRVRSRLENILDYATARGLRFGDNPARWRGGPLKELLTSKPRVIVNHPALPYDQVGQFMVALRQRPGTSARALEFLILTATRTSEAVHAQWSEIDINKGIWHIPAARMKAGRSHRIPLSQAAISVLEAQSKASKGRLVFPREGTTDKPMSSNALLALLKRMSRSDVTPHGFRSTFRDWAAEQTNFPREIAERALAHAPRDKSEAAYQRSDLVERRRPLMEAWAGHIYSTERPRVVLLNRVPRA